MDTILDYVRWTSSLPFGVKPPDAVDSLVFCYLSYLNLNRILKDGQQLSVASCCLAALESGSLFRSVDGGPGHQAMLKALIESKRFGPVQVADYEDVLNESVQFSAMTFLIPDCAPVLAFRGTDDSLSGWKEDFMLSFTQPPSQAMALAYLRRAIGRYGDLCVTGHSKGGNQAWYAATRLPEAERPRLRHIWLNDSPGLSPEVQDTSGVAAVRERAELTLPVSSVIGRIFQADAAAVHIVQSDAIGLLQHDLSHWGIDHGRLLEAEVFDSFSEWVDAVLNRWLEGITLEQREELVNELFDSLAATGASGLQELAAQGPAAFMNVLARLAGMKAGSKRTVAQLLPAALTPDLDLVTDKTPMLQKLQHLKSADGSQALILLSGGLLLLILPHWLLENALPWGILFAALAELGYGVYDLFQNKWDLRRERMRVSLGVVLLTAALLLLLKEHASFLLLSTGLGGLFLLLAYHHAIHLREDRLRVLRRLKAIVFAVLYTAAGMFILIAPAGLFARYSFTAGLLMLADGLISLTAAVRIRWRLQRKKRRA